MGDPELIVLDEPTNGLDPAGMADMRALVVELARGGQTVLLSSHLLAEVQEICDRVGVIDDGRLLRGVDRERAARRGVAAGPRRRPSTGRSRSRWRVAGDDGVTWTASRMLVTCRPTGRPTWSASWCAAGVDVHEVDSVGTHPGGGLLRDDPQPRRTRSDEHASTDGAGMNAVDHDAAPGPSCCGCASGRRSGSRSAPGWR